MAHRAPVEIAAYSPQWPQQFAAERAVLAVVFPRSAFQIEHIGSTAVPGLAAKPIVDVLLGAKTLAEIEARIPATQALGYQYMPEHEVVLPQRRFFAKPVHRPRQFHLHAVQLDSLFWVEHLLFRDSLRSDPSLAQEYLLLKLQLAARFGDDREGYTDAKSSFIRSVVHRAQAAPIHGSVGA